MNAGRAAFLDRDGVINIDCGYVHTQEAFEFVPEVFAAVRELKRMGFKVVVITNQSGIGRGKYTETDFQALTTWMQQRFADEGAGIDAVYYCPHHPTDAASDYRRECDCRKPAPGLFITAARELDIDLRESMAFGDKASDLEAARSAGIAHRFVVGTNGQHSPDESLVHSGLATAGFSSLHEAVMSARVQALGSAACLNQHDAPRFERKIIDAASLHAAVLHLARPLVLTNGVFDILHRGHVTYLAQARALGASLVVAINSDASVRQLGKSDDRPINPQTDRAALIAALESVDIVTIFDERVPLSVLESARPDIYVKGGDYDIDALPETRAVRAWGGRAVAIPFVHKRSTSELLARVRGIRS